MKGSFEGLKGYAVGRMTKSRRGKHYIDDADWGPDAGSIEYGYRVPFGGIHIFIGKRYKKIHFRDDTCLSQ